MNFLRHLDSVALSRLVAMAALFCGSWTMAADVTLPSGWQQMSPADFAAALRPIIFDTDSFDKLSYEEQTGAKERGKDLFLSVDLTASEIDFPTVEVLHWLCRGEIDRSTRDQAAAAMLARQDDWTDRPYSEIRAKIVMMMRLQIDPSAITTEARRWVAAGGTLAEIPPQDLQYERELGVFSDAQYVKGSFWVEWEGLVTAPATGDYTFSISPINVNAGINEHPCKFTMTVSVGGQLILDSSPNGSALNPATYHAQTQAPEWVSESEPVSLTANTPTPIAVTVHATTSGALPDALLHAMLYWEGPGVDKTLVPSANLLSETGGDPGLKGTYRWHEGTELQTLVRVDPQIDFAWTSPNIPLPEDPTIARQAVNTMWSAITDQDYLPALLASGKIHPLLLNPDVSSASLSTVRRGQFLDTLIQNPSLLDSLDLKSIVRVYQAYRFGVPDKALDVFGAWAARHTDYVGGMSTDVVYQGDERLAVATLAICTTQQLPGQADRLKNDYLILPDGRCSLPVAYTLACSYLGQKQYGEWIEFLEGKLADSAVTGDARVNWLIARANAAELSEVSSFHYPHYYYVPYLEPQNGYPSLEEALTAAQSPENKVRVAQEFAARLVYYHEFEQADEKLQTIAASLPEPQQAILADWQQRIAGFVTLEEENQAAKAALAKESHLKELKARREKASLQGDTDAVERYDGLISEAEGQ